MDLVASLDAPCSPDVLFRWVDDLASYPQWLTIVTRAEPLAADPPAWIVDLRGRLGPLARSKRLRMTRTQSELGRLAVFERAEDDGRHHSPWILRAEVTPTDTGSHLRMSLHYGGSLWGPVLERMLRDEVEQGSGRLLALVS
ncbi:MAG TPA: SRPBCC family protein [Acidimicrobiales bacterium]